MQEVNGRSFEAATVCVLPVARQEVCETDVIAVIVVIAVWKDGCQPENVGDANDGLLLKRQPNPLVIVPWNFAWSHVRPEKHCPKPLPFFRGYS